MKEKLLFKIAWLLPKSLVYFATIRLLANATTGKHGNTIVPDLSAMDALKHWKY